MPVESLKGRLNECSGRSKKGVMFDEQVKWDIWRGRLSFIGRQQPGPVRASLTSSQGTG
jgi:hypothetical protein